jgi:cysteine-rich repeat protein
VTADGSTDGAIDAIRADARDASMTTDRPNPTDTQPPTDTAPPTDSATPTDSPLPSDTPPPTDVVDDDAAPPDDVPVVDDVPLPDDVPLAMDAVDDAPPLDDVAPPDDAPPIDDVVVTDDASMTMDVPTMTDAAVVPSDVPMPGCGNGVIEGAEQCDDGNVHNLDGCDAMCRYEPIVRMTNVTISGTAAPAFCMPSTNALGTRVFTTTALGQLNMPLQSDIQSGNTNVLVEVLGLTDLTGATGSMLSLGVMGADPDPARGAWPMAGNPIDWWFLVDGSSVSGGLPVGRITGGSITARALRAGPSTVNLPLTLGGSAIILTMNQAQLRATVNATPAPDVPAPPPGALAPGLTVFQTVSGDGAGQGLCGNITVQSLALIPVPQALTTGFGACEARTGSHTYTYCGVGMPVGPACNSLLDVMVGGCTALSGLLRIANATQPDVAGSGGTVRTLSLGAGNKVQAAQLVGNTDAYSSFMTFTANRAHATGQQCTATSECQTGFTCTAGVCR